MIRSISRINHSPIYSIVYTIQQCCVSIHKIIAESPLNNHHGDYRNEKENENKNASNDIVQKLDIISNDILIKELSKIGYVYSISSEEIDKELVCNEKGLYRVVFDPLDGSSNISAGIPTGTIWGIEDISNISNNKMIKAGYAMYSSSLYFCETLEKGISMSVYDYKNNLYQPINVGDIKKLKNYSINESNSMRWDHKINLYLSDLKQNGYTQRWVGTMVADIHRTILYGGVFCYPCDSKSKKGKLRLVYECRPIAFIFENIGGMALNTTTCENILDMKVTDLHQKCGVIIGEKHLVEKYIKVNEMKSKL